MKQTVAHYLLLPVQAVHILLTVISVPLWFLWKLYLSSLLLLATLNVHQWLAEAFSSGKARQNQYVFSSMAWWARAMGAVGRSAEYSLLSDIPSKNIPILQYSDLLLATIHSYVLYFSFWLSPRGLCAAHPALSFATFLVLLHGFPIADILLPLKSHIVC